MAVFCCFGLQQVNCFTCVGIRKGFSIFLKSSSLKKWKTYTVRVTEESQQSSLSPLTCRYLLARLVVDWVRITAMSRRKVVAMNGKDPFERIALFGKRVEQVTGELEVVKADLADACQEAARAIAEGNATSGDPFVDTWLVSQKRLPVECESAFAKKLLEPLSEATPGQIVFLECNLSGKVSLTSDPFGPSTSFYNCFVAIGYAVSRTPFLVKEGQIAVPVGRWVEFNSSKRTILNRDEPLFLMGGTGYVGGTVWQKAFYSGVCDKKLDGHPSELQLSVLTQPSFQEVVNARGGDTPGLMGKVLSGLLARLAEQPN